MKRVRFVGMDVHAETIAVAVAEEGRGGEVRSLGVIPNREGSIRKLVKRLGPVEELRVCYEAGPTGYALYWQLEALGVSCEVVAPTLVPVKAGERVKTDRRDAEKLARSYRSGDLTAVWVPDRVHEALRDLVRAREAAKRDQLRARHRLTKFLLRHGHRGPEKTRKWTSAWWAWVRGLRLEHLAESETLVDYIHEVEHQGERISRLERSIDSAIEEVPEPMRAVIEGLQALRGIAKIAAVSTVVEVGSFSRFGSPRELMSYAGLVPSEHSSGASRRQGAITKTGNTHLRRIVVEAAWAYRHRPSVGYAHKRRQQGLDPELLATGWKAQHRLHGRYRVLAGRGKPHQKVLTALARELLGFMWAIGTRVETKHELDKAA